MGAMLMTVDQMNCRYQKNTHGESGSRVENQNGFQLQHPDSPWMGQASGWDFAQTSGVWPGTATGGTGNVTSHS